MSSVKIYTSQQFDEYQDQPHCPRCNEHQQIYIQLECTHKFCIVCITFAYLKFKGTLSQKNHIKCLHCEQLSELDQHLHDLIREVISKELGPIVKNQGENFQSRMSINHTHLEASNNSQRVPLKYNLRSEEDSMLHNAAQTPNKNKQGFYSKFESPQNSPLPNEDSCIIHPTEDVSYVCMSCGVKPLCYKCIKSNKHSSHDVKIVKKAIEVINEKFSLLHLETAQKIQNIQLYQKRLYDRKLIFQDRIQKSIKEIKNVFISLEKKIMEKSQQIISEYQEFYQGKIQQMEGRAQESQDLLKNMKQFQEIVEDFMTSNQGILSNKNSPIRACKALQKYEEIENKRRKIAELTAESSLLMAQKNNNMLSMSENIFYPINSYNSELIRHIITITESVESMSLAHFNNSEPIKDLNERARFNDTIPYTSIMKSDILFNKNKTMTLKNCSSREKLQKINQLIPEEPYAKRIKTNIPASLNTSRDKRQKKPTTKTEEDERRLKTKANYKTEANTQAKNSQKTQKPHHSKDLPIPAYITKHLQKHQMANGSRKVSPFGGTMCLMENLHNSKNTSKLVSKTMNVLHNDDFNNRKKNNIRETHQAESNKEKEKKHMIKSAKNSQVAKKKR